MCAHVCNLKCTPTTGRIAIAVAPSDETSRCLKGSVQGVPRDLGAAFVGVSIGWHTPTPSNINIALLAQALTSLNRASSRSANSHFLGVIECVCVWVCARACVCVCKLVGEHGRSNFPTQRFAACERTQREPAQKSFSFLCLFFQLCFASCRKSGCNEATRLCSTLLHITRRCSTLLHIIMWRTT